MRCRSRSDLDVPDPTNAEPAAERNSVPIGCSLMTTREDLETLSSRQLREQAIQLAKTRGDIDWLWSLLGSIPATEGQLGDLEDSGLDIPSLISGINGYIRADGSADETLRSRNVDYLLEHL